MSHLEYFPLGNYDPVSDNMFGFTQLVGESNFKMSHFDFPVLKKKLAVKLVTDNSSMNHCNSIIYSTVLWNASCKQGFKINKKNVGKKGKSLPFGWFI